MKIKVDAYAKINLMLDICARRRDGYHDLFMIMQSIGLCDTVTVKRIKGSDISISCNIDDIPLDEKNIAYKAAQQFFIDNKINRRRRGISIDIVKRIPHDAGLAGGSADGAAVISALNILYKTGLSEKELCKTGVKIGADVPFCIVGGTKLAQGIGEVLSDVKPLRRCYIVLIKPDFGVNTKNAFAQFDEFGKVHSPDCLSMLKAIQSRDLTQISSRLENVFEQFIEVHNRVDIKDIMRNSGALGVCMSGSGPTIYGIFDDKEKADNAAKELKLYSDQIFICRPVNKGYKIKVIDE